MSDDDQHDGKQADYAQMTSSRYGFLLSLAIESVFSRKPRRGVKNDPAATGATDVDQSRRALFDLIGEKVSMSRTRTSLGTLDRVTGLTTITQIKGNHLHSMGHTLPGGILVLYPEEAAWLVSRHALIVDDADFEDYCQLMFNTTDGWISYERFQVYAYFRRLGYVVRRDNHLHPPPPSTPSTWQTRLVVKLRSMASHFTLWLSGLARVLSHVTMPLVKDGQYGSYRAVYSALQLLPFTPWHTPLVGHHARSSAKQQYTLSWNVYKPNLPFKKRDPRPPDFRVVVGSMLDPLPLVGTFQYLFKQSPGTPAFQPLRNTRSPETAPTFIMALVDDAEGVVFMRFTGNGIAPVGYAV